MKVLVHRSPISTAEPFILQDVKDYLRVTHTDEDAVIAPMARSAALDLESFAQIALLTQTIRVTVFDPLAATSCSALPIGPVPDDASCTVALDGDPFDGFELLPGLRPSIRWLSSFYDLRPSRITVEYEAGFGADATNIPHDLAQAIKDQTCLQYLGRSPFDKGEATASPHMARIGARYRGVGVG